MSTEKEIEENLKWEEYKKKVISGDGVVSDKYLRSAFRGKVRENKEETKVGEPQKEDDTKSGKFSTTLPGLKKVKKKKKDSKQKKKKEATKQTQNSEPGSDDEVQENKSIISSISPSQSIKLQKSSSNVSKNGGVNCYNVYTTSNTNVIYTNIFN
jgi:hypothetical protein